MIFSRIFFTLGISFGFLSWAQTPKEPTKKYYVNQNGKLFWNADLPFYLFGASDSTGADVVKLTAPNALPYSSPLFFDTEGDNFFRAKWAVNPINKKKISPELEIKYAVYRDGTPPATFVRFLKAKSFRREGIQFYGKGLQLKLSATDGPGAGVEAIYFSINEGEYAEYTDKFTVSEPGDKLLKIYSTDFTGNMEKEKSFRFRIDTTSPRSRHSLSNDYMQNILSSRTSLQISSTDPNESGVSDTYYKIDGKKKSTYLSPLSFQDLKEGDHTIEYFAVDQVGNLEHPKSFDFFLDKSAPVVQFNVIGDQYQNRGRVYVSERTKIELIAEDNKAGVAEVTYQIDGGATRVYTEPFSLPKGPGTHTIHYFAKDKIGNFTKGEIKQEVLNKRSLAIDMVPPVISHNYQGKRYRTRDTVFITSDTKVALLAKDATSGVKSVGFKINGSEGKLYKEPFTLAENGIYTIDYFATDEVNNRNVDQFFVEVDNTAPTITSVISSEPIGSIQLKKYDGPLEVYPKGVRLFLAAQDNRIDVSKIVFRLNKGKEVQYTGPVELSQPGVVVIKVKAYDFLGNMAEEEKVIYINNN